MLTLWPSSQTFRPIGIYPRDMKTCVYTNTNTQRYIAPLFIIAPNGNNPNTRQYVKKKLWYIHATEYYSVVKRNKILIRGIVWIHIKNVQLLF